MAKATGTTLVIDLGALAHNYHYLRAKLDPQTKFLGVVKAFAYGSDAVTIAKKLVSLGVDYLAVAYAEEGVALRRAGIAIPILVLHPLPANFKALLAHNLEPSLYSINILKGFVKVVASESLQGYPVHLKFNTGLNRLGCRANDVDLAIHCIKEAPEIKIVSVFSHLAASEDLKEKEFTEGQIALYSKIVAKLDKSLGYRPIRHLLNTSGIINYAQAQFDMVRSGIGLYGFGNDKNVDPYLRPVATLKTVISQIHHLGVNETVGYNRAFKTETAKVTATLPLGHADGIGRIYGNGKAYVSILGRPARIIGNVCMDMVMVDVTGIDCKEGDEVIVFGLNPSAEDFATGAGTISYELLTGISQRVKRVVLDS